MSMARGGRPSSAIIAPLTNNFCASCNRIRVTATSELYACLGGAEEVDLRAALRSDAPDADACRRARRGDTDQARAAPLPHRARLEPAEPRRMSLTGG